MYYTPIGVRTHVPDLALTLFPVVTLSDLAPNQIVHSIQDCANLLWAGVGTWTHIISAFQLDLLVSLSYIYNAQHSKATLHDECHDHIILILSLDSTLCNANGISVKHIMGSRIYGCFEIEMKYFRILNCYWGKS